MRTKFRLRIFIDFPLIQGQYILTIFNKEPLHFASTRVHLPWSPRDWKYFSHVRFKNDWAVNLMFSDERKTPTKIWQNFFFLRERICTRRLTSKLEGL